MFLRIPFPILVQMIRPCVFCPKTKPPLLLLFLQLLLYDKIPWPQPKAKSRLQCSLSIDNYLRQNLSLAYILYRRHMKTKEQQKTPKQIFYTLFSQQHKLRNAMDDRRFTI